MGPPRMQMTGRLLTSLAALAALLPAASAAVGFRCEQVVADGARWDLSPLAGPHAATHDFREEPKMARWTFTLDLCGALKDDSKVDDKHRCPTNTRGSVPFSPKRDRKRLTRA
jgi:autophagy-related protein 27